MWAPAPRRDTKIPPQAARTSAVYALSSLCCAYRTAAAAVRTLPYIRPCVGNKIMRRLVHHIEQRPAAQKHTKKWNHKERKREKRKKEKKTIPTATPFA